MNEEDGWHQVIDFTPSNEKMRMPGVPDEKTFQAVSYTHLTLPTILLV